MRPSLPSGALNDDALSLSELNDDAHSLRTHHTVGFVHRGGVGMRVSKK